ncbi:hypothetical protein ACSMX9_15885 [Streptomyces sp. LE64]|uniref:hypothetical protein n=1 Tax=Streptomyces sp. LE64 TaxID=3448653 RepID=UPI00404256A8
MEPPRPDEEPSGPPDRRRGRTALPLLATAAALGLLAGTCVGYLVQADRAPTPLAPLSQPVVPAAATGADAPTDPPDRADGDLRKLLLPVPRGAVPTLSERGWLPLEEHVARYGVPAERLDELVRFDFRRSAATSWHLDDRTVHIRLDQYHKGPGYELPRITGFARFETEQATGTVGTPLPGSANGTVHAATEPEPGGGPPVYASEAHAWRGDVALHIVVTSSTPLPVREITELARRQVARL